MRLARRRRADPKRGLIRTDNQNGRQHDVSGGHDASCPGRLVRRGWLVEGGAKGKGGVGVDSVVALVDQTDDSLLIDDDVGAESPLIVLIFDVVSFQDAVRGEHLAVHVTEQRKVKVVLLGKGGIRGGTVHADAEDGGVFRGNAA